MSENNNIIQSVFKKFISFDHMIAPHLIKVLFLFLTICVVISGLTSIFNSFGYYGNGWLFVFGIIEIIFGTLASKVFCELLIVIFKINDNLEQIRKNTMK